MHAGEYYFLNINEVHYNYNMYNKNGCGQGYSLSIGARHVGVVIMVPINHFQKLRPMSKNSITLCKKSISIMY